MLALKRELATNSSNSIFYAESAATFLGVHLLKHYSTRKFALKDYQGGLPKYKLQQTIDYIQAHLTENISLEDLAAEAGMSRYYFCRLFKQSTGITPHQLLIKCRIDRAKHLLLRTKHPIAHIAVEVGFNSQSHFSKHFRKLTLP